jgi:hypothetical protein
MDRLHERTRPFEERSDGADYTAAGLMLILLILAALVLAVLMGDSIAFPRG